MAPHDDGYGWHNSDGSPGRAGRYLEVTPSVGYDELSVDSQNYYGNTAQTTIGSDSSGGGWDYGPALNSAIGGAIAFGGTAYSANQANEQGNKARDFTKRMEETRYQRTMADMRKAGLNPMLAYQQGGGSGASGGIPSMPDAGAAIAGGMNAGSKTKQNQMAMRKLNAEVRLLDAGTAASSAQARKAEFEGRIIAAGIPAAEAQALWDQTHQQELKTRRGLQVGMENLGNAPGVMGPRMNSLGEWIDRGLKPGGWSMESMSQGLDNYVNKPKKKGRDY